MGVSKPLSSQERGLERGFYEFTNTSKEKDVASVELIHEVLITAWSRLKNWIEQDWEFRRWQEKLRDNLSQWEQEKKDDYLLQGGL